MVFVNYQMVWDSKMFADSEQESQIAKLLFDAGKQLDADIILQMKELKYVYKWHTFAMLATHTVAILATHTVAILATCTVAILATHTVAILATYTVAILALFLQFTLATYTSVMLATYTCVTRILA